MNSSTAQASDPTTPTKTTKARIVVWILMGLLVLTGTLGFAVARGAATGTAPEDAGQVVRANSRVLSQAPDEKAQLVEFLDFECEACLAAHPFVEELRREHGDTVTVIHRYFPMPGHRNAMNAAIAVEAAAQQGKYAAMHRKMFRTQTQWGGSAEDKSALFRSFAQDLGLDLAAYDRAVADPATADRIRLDKADGLALGISGTPTFFLNGEPLVADSLEEFRALVEKAAQRP